MRGILSASSSSTYYAVYWICLALILTYIALLIYLYLNELLDHEANSTLVGVTSAMALFSHTIAFLPFFGTKFFLISWIELFLLQYQCSNGTMSLYSSLQCFSGTTLIFSIVSVVILILYVPLTVAGVLMCNETRKIDSNMTGKYGIKLDAIFLIFKSFIVLASLFCPNVWISCDSYLLG